MKKIIRVKTKPSKINGGCIFDAELQKFRPRKKVYAGTKEIECFVGAVNNAQPGDLLEVDAEEGKPYHGMPLNKILTYTTILPVENAEMEKYLIKHFSGIGKAKAHKMVSTFGVDVFSAINYDPSILEAYSLTKKTIADLEFDAGSLCSIDGVIEILAKAGLAEYANTIVNLFPGKAIKVCQNSPYMLYLQKIMTFDEADRLQAANGLPADDTNRICAAIIEVLVKYAKRFQGIYLVEAELKKAVERCINREHLFDYVTVTDEMLEAALNNLEQQDLVKKETVNDEQYIYLRDLYVAKINFISAVHQLEIHSKKMLFSQARVEDYIENNAAWLSTEQKMAVMSSLTEPITLITGGAGSGKTETIKAIIDTAEKLTYRPKILLTAPTGKAADRLRSVTGRNAATIHSLVFNKDSLQKELRNSDFLIIDEATMVDLKLAVDIFYLIPKTCRVIMVGDNNQLPPIEPGRPFHDLVLSGKIPVVTLKKNWRQSSNTIAENANRIIEGNSDFTFDSTFSFIEAEENAVKDKTLTCIRELKRNGVSLAQVQVISPKKLVRNGTKEINSFLQIELNGNASISEQNQGGRFFIGDRVIQTANNYEIGVYNGEIGIVSAVEIYPHNCTIVKYPDKTITYDADSSAELDLAYAITAHKAQGSEYRAVIIICTDETMKGFNRNLLYTAVTRAKECVIMIGSTSAFEEAILKRETVVPGLSEQI